MSDFWFTSQDQNSPTSLLGGGFHYESFTPTFHSIFDLTEGFANSPLNDYHYKIHIDRYSCVEYACLM